MRYLLFASVLLCGCTWADGRAWHAGDYAAQVATFGMYGLAKGPRIAQTVDVDNCVKEGGDPAACRAAVYGTLAPRTTVRVVAD